MELVKQAIPTIINATQHAPTLAQVEAGVCMSVEVAGLMTFKNIPIKEEMVERAEEIAEAILKTHILQCECNCIDPEVEKCYAMIGGAPFFMSTLEAVLKDRGIIPLYAFSERNSVEEVQPDGSVRKVNVFEHLGFVEA